MSFVVGSFIAWIGTTKKSIANIYERKILLPHSQNNAAFCCRREERRHYAGAKMPKKIIIQSNWWFVWCNMWVCAACVFVCVTWKKQAKWIRERKKTESGHQLLRCSCVWCMRAHSEALQTAYDDGEHGMLAARGCQMPMWSRHKEECSAPAARELTHTHT